MTHTTYANFTGSTGYWHGIMHRREEDFGNAKYWFCRLGVHAIFRPLGGVAGELARDTSDETTAFLRRQTIWDPNPFVDLCQESLDAGSDHNRLCRQIQRAEWELLFEDCYRAAIGGQP